MRSPAGAVVGVAGQRKQRRPPLPGGVPGAGLHVEVGPHRQHLASVPGLGRRRLHGVEQAGNPIEQAGRTPPTSNRQRLRDRIPPAIDRDLADRHAGGLSFAGVRAFLLDEYVGLPAGHPQSYRSFIARELEAHVDFAPGAIAAPDVHAPDLLAACRAAVAGGREDLDFFRLDAPSFAKAYSQSIDYAVMELTDNARVVPVDMGWSDIGSFAAIWEIGDKDSDGNVKSGDVVTENVRDSYLRTDGPLLAAIGLENVIVVATGDAVLVVSKNAVEDVRAVVETLKTEDRTEHLAHSRVYRPWGWYQTLDLGDRFKVKHLMVKAGHRLSLQAHEHRAEHWVVVAGTARVTRGDEVITLHENESVYLPAGIKHRLENQADEPLSVIEVQSGSYLGEDDIVRFEDEYGRE